MAASRSVGILYCLGGILMMMAGVRILFTPTEVLVVGIFLLLFGGILIFGVVKLRKLDPAARVPVGLLSGIGLLGFPLGTLINGCILHLVFSQKGSFIVSDEYRQIRERTPQIEYRSSAAVKIFVVLVVVGVIAALIFAVSV